ncbi:insulinase family protein [Candidatus Saccharibacteria bacterium]|nr:insulinase family protein [Candidatus Saccharibacteria bacterium]
MQHDISEQTLPSGAKGLLVNVPGAPVYNIVVRFNSGYQFGNFERFELPHVLEHMMGCGSAAYPKPNEFKVEVTKNGAYRNANTSSRVNGYVLECAAFELPRILDLLEEYLARPTFPAEALPTELSNVSEELSRNITDHDRAVGIALLAKSFPKDFMAYEPRIKQLSRISRDDVTAYYAQTHTAKNARFYIAGDIDEARQASLLERLEQIFSQLPEGKRLVYRDDPGTSSIETIVTQRSIEPLYYICEVYGGGMTDQERRALKLLRVMLFGGFASRVYGEARRRGLAYHIGGGVNASSDSSALSFSGNVSWPNAAPLFELAVTEILKLRDEGPSEAEVQAGIDLIIGSMDRSLQTAGDTMGYYLGLYDAEERIVMLAEEQAAIRALMPKDVQHVARIARTGAAHGLSLLGDPKPEAQLELETIAARLWS